MELVFLMARRCRDNLAYAEHIIEKQYAHTLIATHFRKIVSALRVKAIEKYQTYDQDLRAICDRISSRVKDRWDKTFHRSYFEEKELYLNDYERLAFSKSEQISFTYETYIIEVINQLKGGKEDVEKMRNLLKAYRQINQMSLEEAESKGFDRAATDIIKQKL